MSNYKNSSLPAKERARHLLSLMTVDEKIDQMLLTTDIESLLNGLENGSANIVYGSSYSYQNYDFAAVNKLQELLLNKTRLGIPLLVMGESLHGVMHEKCTVFPQAVGLGSAFNENLIEEVATAIGKEAEILGIKMTYAPNVDISRDPRWGRVEENYGEDPYLSAKLGAAYVRGFQKSGSASCPKHYIAHGTPEGGINLAPVHIGERELREVMTEPFKACIDEGCMGIMPAYSEYDGVPVHSSEFLMRKLLREELKFDGITVSDFGATQMLLTLHKITDNTEEAAELVLKAGIDIEAPLPVLYNQKLRENVKSGKVPIAYIDECVLRILTVKFKLGLFENPYAKTAQAGELNSVSNKRLARRAAQESIVLLKNDGILPIKKKDKKIAVIGPNSTFAQLGDYTHFGSYEKVKSLADVFKKNYENAVFSRGCDFAFAENGEIEAAVEAAKNSDLIILAVGDNSAYYGGIGWGEDDYRFKSAVTCGEGFDVSELVLPDIQSELTKKLQALKKPIITVLYTGRPYAIGEIADNSSAVLQAWYPGEEGSFALYDIIFGHVNPSGKLPVSFPRSTGAIPCYYNHKVSARGFYMERGSKKLPGRDYVFDTPDALFSFGFGLSYTTFNYSGLNVVYKNHAAKVSVVVENTGDIDGYETVLLFLSNATGPVTPFVKRLRGFKKIYLKTKEKITVEFCLTAADFECVDLDMKRRIVKGKHTAAIDTLKTEFTVE